MLLFVELAHLPRVQHTQPTQHRIPFLRYLRLQFGLWTPQGEPGRYLALLVLPCKLEVSDALRRGLLRQIRQGGGLHGGLVSSLLLEGSGNEFAEFSLIILEALREQLFDLCVREYCTGKTIN